MTYEKRLHPGDVRCIFHRGGAEFGLHCTGGAVERWEEAPEEKRTWISPKNLNNFARLLSGKRVIENSKLLELVRYCWALSNEIYGIPGVFKDLREGGHTTDENRIAKIMGLNGIKIQQAYRMPQGKYSFKAFKNRLSNRAPSRSFDFFFSASPNRSINRRACPLAEKSGSAQRAQEAPSGCTM